MHTSHRENSGAAEGEKYLKILEDYNFKLEKKIIDMNENLEALTSQLKKKKWFDIIHDGSLFFCVFSLNVLMLNVSFQLNAGNVDYH